MKQISYQVAFRCVSKEAEKLGELCPPNPLAGTLLLKNGAAAAAQQMRGNRRRRALGRARLRAAKSCGVRGSHFPALLDFFNLERNLVSDNG